FLWYVMLTIIGFGYTAQYLAKTVDNMPIVATKRKPSCTEFNHVKIMLFDNFEIPKDTTHLLISTPASISADGKFIDPAFDLVDSQLGNLMKLKWLGLLSATSVYGDTNGNWVDENTIVKPNTPIGQIRLQQEQQWQQTANQLATPLQIFRLSGIYGPDETRNKLSRLLNNKIKHSIIKEGHYFSRIWVEDIAQIIKLSMARENSNFNIYNLTDDFPCSANEVLDYLCNLLNKPFLPKIDYEQALAENLITPMMQQFYNSNKRVKNDKVKTDFDWQPKFANFKLAYNHLVKYI
ncbi:MAG: NAD-dependent epimerase/dehydratase family protein, partial [Pseudomonadota bacterium]